MNTKQALDLGVIQARARLQVLEASEGPAAAAEYAKGMALYARDYLREQTSERDTCFWFTCLGQDAITQPEGA